MSASILCSLLLLAFTSLAQNSPPPAKVRVPDAATALSIAEPKLIKVYGKRQIDSERPLIATLADGIWTVGGTMCRECVGGVAVLKLRQRDGKILSISHPE